MKNIVCFGASNSKDSINKKIVVFTSKQILQYKTEILDLNDFKMPLYGIDYEQEYGIPQKAYEFQKYIANAEGIIISFAEHNGSYTTAFKNIFDWISRIEENNEWKNKKLFFLATSPGKRGGQSVLETAVGKFKRMTRFEIISFSLPSFFENFNSEKGITNRDLNNEFNKKLNRFLETLES